jgi:hypothetical protein
MKEILVARKAFDGVLDQLRRLDVRDQERRLDQEERPVEVPHDGDRVLGRGADDDAVRPHEVLDGGSLPQELRIRHHVEGDGGLLIGADDLGDPFAGADRHRALGHDDLVAVHGFRHLAGHGVDEAQIGGAVALGRRAHREKDHERLLHALFQVGGEAQAALAEVLSDQFLQPGLVDRDLAPLQVIDLGGVAVDAGYIDTEFGKARGRDETDVADTYDANVHRVPSERSFPAPAGS